MYLQNKATGNYSPVAISCAVQSSCQLLYQLPTGLMSPAQPGLRSGPIRAQGSAWVFAAGLGPGFGGIARTTYHAKQTAERDREMGKHLCTVKMAGVTGEDSLSNSHQAQIDIVRTTGKRIDMVGNSVVAIGKHQARINMNAVGVTGECSGLNRTQER
ncbi:hypothetical protein L210DRAFT_3503938 [Boletus edulis BED1]|uniref:Uncharacterized protein n=1 Tax=Boletus edulis BED1 TaxID=1328754 RepID=A0AAD4BUB3_BOLED|nr:hypothetical protein L210DRAFT_3503938 [Boletus edulis BED1]